MYHFNVRMVYIGNMVDSGTDKIMVYYWQAVFNLFAVVGRAIIMSYFIIHS